MRKLKTNRIVLSGMLIAVGIMLPFVTAHAFGVPGTLLLPMHIPVFLIGLLCGSFYGAVGGIVIPVMSSLLTGMPPAYPALPLMMGELFTYGMISGVLYKKWKLSIYPSLLISMLCGRLIYSLLFMLLLFTNGGVLKALSAPAAFLQGIPGIVIQLVLLPVIVKSVERYFHKDNGQESIGEQTALREAKQLIKEEKATCVIIKNQKIIYTAEGPGVAPLLTLIDSDPEMLRGSFVVDKVIGKAAAMIAEFYGAREIYGNIMSTAAKEYLIAHHIKISHGTCVNIISNRTGDGLCPLEKAILDVDDPEKAIMILRDTIKKLHKAG